MTTKGTHTLAALFRDALASAKRSGKAQKLGLTAGVLLKVQVQGRQARLLVARRSSELDLSDLAMVRGMCAVPRQARRIPDTGQHEQEIGGARYYAVEYRWGL